MTFTLFRSISVVLCGVFGKNFEKFDENSLEHCQKSKNLRHNSEFSRICGIVSRALKKETFVNAPLTSAHFLDDVPRHFDALKP